MVSAGSPLVVAGSAEAEAIPAAATEVVEVDFGVGEGRGLDPPLELDYPNPFRSLGLDSAQVIRILWNQQVRYFSADDRTYATTEEVRRGR